MICGINLINKTLEASSVAFLSNIFHPPSPEKKKKEHEGNEETI